MTNIFSKLFKEHDDFKDTITYQRQIDSAYCEGAHKERELIANKIIEFLDKSNNELYDETAKQILRFIEKRSAWKR